jgi:hypothetical protein
MRLSVIDLPESQPPAVVDGVVHSVFARVMNLSLGHGHDRDALALDARSTSGTLPGSARLEVPAVIDFTREVQPGARIALRGGVLRISGSRISVDFRGGKSRPDVPAPQFPAAFLINWGPVWDGFIDQRRRAGLANAFTPSLTGSTIENALVRRARLVIPPLLRSVAAGDGARAQAGVARLIGVGPGHTPSGDDFVTGLILGLQRAARTREQRQFANELTQHCVVLARSSTDISRQYITHAAAGRFASTLTQLADAVDGRRHDINASLSSALALGHSSGSDTVFGLLSGMACGTPQLRDRIVTALAANPVTEDLIS